MTEVATVKADVAWPTYPHLDNLERVLVSDPDYLTRPITITEKVHGFNARVGRDLNGVLWYGSRGQGFALSDPSGPTLQGFREIVSQFDFLEPGLTVYGEWAGKGIQKGIDYGEKRFYIFAERVGPDSLVRGTQEVLDKYLDFGFKTVPIIAEGPGESASLLMPVLDGLRNGGSELAPGQGIEGIVVAPITPIRDVYGHQVIAKYKSAKFAELSHARKEHPTPADLSIVKNFAEEYVNSERLQHVLGQVWDAHHPLHDQPAIDVLDVVYTGDVLRAMYQDVIREGAHDYEKLSDVDKKRLGKAINVETLAYLKIARDVQLAESIA